MVLDLFARRHYVSLTRTLAFLLLGVLAFLSLALFSPLHQHQTNGHCTLNDFELVVVSHAQIAVPSLELSLLMWREAIVHEQSATRNVDPTLFQRGPPDSL